MNQRVPIKLNQQNENLPSVNFTSEEPYLLQGYISQKKYDYEDEDEIGPWNDTLQPILTLSASKDSSSRIMSGRPETKTKKRISRTSMTERTKKISRGAQAFEPESCEPNDLNNTDLLNFQLSSNQPKSKQENTEISTQKVPKTINMCSEADVESVILDEIKENQIVKSIFQIQERIMKEKSYKMNTIQSPRSKSHDKQNSRNNSIEDYRMFGTPRKTFRDSKQEITQNYYSKDMKPTNLSKSDIHDPNKLPTQANRFRILHTSNSSQNQNVLYIQDMRSFKPFRELTKNTETEYSTFKLMRSFSRKGRLTSEDEDKVDVKAKMKILKRIYHKSNHSLQPSYLSLDKKKRSNGRSTSNCWQRTLDSNYNPTECIKTEPDYVGKTKEMETQTDENLDPTSSDELGAWGSKSFASRPSSSY